MFDPLLVAVIGYLAFGLNVAGNLLLARKNILGWIVMFLPLVMVAVRGSRASSRCRGSCGRRRGGR